MADFKRSEHPYGEVIDRCLYNSLIKFVAGVGVGIVLSAAVFKRRMWPVVLGGSMGAGMGISDCRHDFNNKSLLTKIIQSPRNKVQEVLSEDKSISS